MKRILLSLLAVTMLSCVAVNAQSSIRYLPSTGSGNTYQQPLIGGEWKNVLSVNHAERCRASSYGSSLERQFMFKCYIMAFGGVIIYFDL